MEFLKNIFLKKCQTLEQESKMSIKATDKHFLNM